MNIKHNTERLLEAAKNGNLTEVNRLIPLSDPQHNYSAALRAAIDNNQIECVKALIGVSGEYDFVLQAAARNNRVECVKMLLPFSNDHRPALHAAVDQNHIKCVKLLIPGSGDTGPALCIAVQNHFNECAQLLLTDGLTKSECSPLLLWNGLTKDRSHMNQYALRTAVEFGNTEGVKMLLPFVDPTINDSEALRLAAHNGYTECLELLYPVSDPVVALEILQKECPNDYSVWGKLEQMVEVERVQNMLNAEIGSTGVVKAQRKM